MQGSRIRHYTQESILRNCIQKLRPTLLRSWYFPPHYIITFICHQKSFYPISGPWPWWLGRVENCKSSQNQMSQCFFNGFWCVETEGNFFFAKKNIFDGWKWTRNLGFGHFQRFLHFFFEWQKIKFILTIPSMSIVIWNLHAKSFPMVPWCLKKNII